MARVRRGQLGQTHRMFNSFHMISSFQLVQRLSSQSGWAYIDNGCPGYILACEFLANDKQSKQSSYELHENRGFNNARWCY